MTELDRNAINPLPPFTPLSNITPFTYRDGRTFLRVLEELRARVNSVIDNENNQNDLINTTLEAQNQTISDLLSQLIGYTINVGEDTYRASMMDGSDFEAYTIDGTNKQLTELEATLSDVIDTFKGETADEFATVTPRILSAITDNVPSLIDERITNLNPEIVDAVVDAAAGISGLWRQRGILDVHADTLKLEQHQGIYVVSNSGAAETGGMPEIARGILTVEWAWGSNLDTSNSIQTFKTVSHGTWRRESTDSGWTAWKKELENPYVRGLLDPAETDPLTLRAETDSGLYGVFDGSYSSQLGLPTGVGGGTLEVKWIRGTGQNGVARQIFTTERRPRRTFERTIGGIDPHDWVETTNQGGGTVVVDGTVTNVDVIVVAGQSNASGRGTPYGDHVGDRPDGRIWEFGSKNRTLRPAGVPLDMHDNATGISPGTTFAREWVKNAPAGTIALLIPAAHGGTGFNGADTWNWGDTGGEWSLYAAMMSQISEAITAAESEWDGANVAVRVMLWHQGEQGSPYQGYLDDFEAFVTRFRDVYPDTPVILGELSPDRDGGAYDNNVGRAHQIIPELIPGTGLAWTPPNVSRHEDLAHLGRYGVVALGENMYQEFVPAAANITANGDRVMPPPNLYGERQPDDSLFIWWGTPICRTTGYIVEHSTDGNTWLTTGIERLGRRAWISDTNAKHVRVSTIGAEATSRPTHPIYIR